MFDYSDNILKKIEAWTIIYLNKSTYTNGKGEGNDKICMFSLWLYL